MSKERMRSLRIGDDEISGRENLNTDESMARYPLMVAGAAFLARNKYVKNSAIFGIVGHEERCPESRHHFLYTPQRAW